MMSADIISISTRRHAMTFEGLASPCVGPSRTGSSPKTNEMSTTGKNKRLRDKRRVIWERARSALEYWQARLQLYDAVWLVQDREAAEGALHPPCALGDREILRVKCEEAMVKQLLTPGHCLGSVEWKQHELVRRDYIYRGHANKIEKCIAADLAFLAAHPFRRERGSKRR